MTDWRGSDPYLNSSWNTYIVVKNGMKISAEVSLHIARHIQRNYNDSYILHINPLPEKRHILGEWAKPKSSLAMTIIPPIVMGAIPLLLAGIVIQWILQYVR